MSGPHSLTRQTVKREAKAGAAGVYLLRNSRTGPPRYVGRSGNVQRRLLEHAREADYSLFTVEHISSLKKAWHREAHLYHYHKSTLDNKQHPRAPNGMSCPKCSAV